MNGWLWQNYVQVFKKLTDWSPNQFFPYQYVRTLIWIISKEAVVIFLIVVALVAVKLGLGMTNPVVSFMCSLTTEIFAQILIGLFLFCGLITRMLCLYYPLLLDTRFINIVYYSMSLFYFPVIFFEAHVSQMLKSKLAYIFFYCLNFLLFPFLYFFLYYMLVILFSS